ncbi:MAG: phage tail tape measure C-terminal domain-containing protein [Reyranella sp.]|nr:phage tail tape measure C-terminal domain-containing protein [Reyranella sp.]
MTDFTVSARIDGDAEGLVDALTRGDKAVEDFQKRNDERARRGGQVTLLAAAAEKQRVEATDAGAKAVEAAAVANDNAAEATARYVDQAKALGDQVGKVARALATGRDSGRAFGDMALGIGRTALAIGGAFGVAAVAATTFFVAGVAHADALLARTRILQVELAALGQSDRLPTGRLTGAIDLAAQAPGFNRGQTGDAAQEFLLAGVFDPDLIERGLRSSRDIALSLGGDLNAAARLAAEGLNGTAAGVEKLDGKLKLLTDSERVQIRTLQEMGRSHEAATVVLDALGRRFDGLGDQALGVGHKVADGFGKAWGRALDALADTAPVQAAQRALAGLGNAIADGLAPDLRDAGERLAEVNRRLVEIAASRALLSSQGGAQEMYSLQRERALLEQRVVEQAADAASIFYGDRPAAADDAEKRVRELVETLDALPRKREQIGNAVQRINDEFAQGAISAELYARAVGLLDAQLAGLRSPLERSGETLADLRALAATPVTGRPAREAELRAQREAAGLPPDQRDEFVANAVEIRRLQDQLRADRSAQRSDSRGTAGALKEFDRATLAYREQTEALERLVAAEGQGAAAMREAERANQVAIATSKVRAAVEADGSAAISAAAHKQIEVYEALSRRHAEAERRREAQAFEVQYDPDAAFEANMARLADLQATGLLSARTVYEASREFEGRRLDASRDATEGMIAGLRRYADEASNAGRQAADGIRTGMRAAEDAVANFAVTGAFNFNSFTNSVLADLARVATRQAITGPLANAASSALGDVGSWLGDWWRGGTSVPGISGGPVAVGGIPTVPAFHQGGIVGRDGTNPRTLPAALFARAPRFHGGGVVLGADEMPIIAKRGERVLTEEEQRAWNGNGGGSSVTVAVTVVNNAGADVRTEEGIGADGMPRLSIIIDKAEQHLAQKFVNTQGPLYKAVTATLGVKQVPR